MKQKRYSATALCKDEAFVQWVFHPDEESDAYWATYLKHYPEQKQSVSRARTMLITMKSGMEENDSFRERDRIEVLQRLREKQWGEGVETAVERNQEEKVKELPIRNRGKKLLLAVGFILVLGLGIYTVYELDLFKSGTTVQIPPQITLQLQDGSEQVIDERDTRTITTEAGQHLGSQQQNILIYENDKNARELVYNELTVPYGRTFELVLSDDSHIYLNAGSHLRYPVQFLPGQPRDVFLDGEAFFEVAKDEHRPFTVRTQQMNTRVYGTKFNVTSYKNEGNTYTVLVEGSVGVYPDEANKAQPVKIKPGQRAVFKQGEIALEEVNIRKYTAWTSGELYFLNDPFELILKKLERQYNVSIDNTYPELNVERMTCSFKHGGSLELVLNILKKLKAFDYTIDGNTVVIAPPDL